MTCTDAQVRLIMRERNQGRSQQQAAVKANLKSRKTVYKYERLGQLPSELKQPRAYRTRADPFAADWSEVERLLAASCQFTAYTTPETNSNRAPVNYSNTAPLYGRSTPPVREVTRLTKSGNLPGRYINKPWG
jgi:hypothetical protein